jgi:hypothetical protein
MLSKIFLNCNSILNCKIPGLIVMLYFFNSCNQSDKSSSNIYQGTVTDKVVIIDTTYQFIADTIRLSKIADSLFYFQLEFPGTKVKMDIHKIMTSRKYLYIHSNQKLFQYDWEGKFVKEFENNNEPVSGFDLIEKNNMLLVAYPKKIIIGNLEGEFYKTIPLNPGLQNLGSYFAAIDSGNIAISVWNTGVNLFRMVIINNEGNIVKEFVNNEAFSSENAPLRNASRYHRMVFRDKGVIYYQPLFNDTLFQLNNLELKPVFVEKMTFKVPLTERLEYTGDLDRYQKYCRNNSAYLTRSMASKRYFFIEAKNASLINAFPVYMLYDRKTDQFNYYNLTVDFSKDIIHIGVLNDWDGGIALNSEFIDNDYMIGYYEIKKFIQFNKDEYILKSCIDSSNVCTIKKYTTCSHIVSRQSRKELLNNFLHDIDEKKGGYVLMFARLKD